MTEQDRNWMNGRFDSLKEELTLVRIEIAKLKVKAGIFGVIGGIIPIALTLCVYWITRA